MNKCYSTVLISNQVKKFNFIRNFQLLSPFQLGTIPNSESSYFNCRIESIRSLDRFIIIVILIVIDQMKIRKRIGEERKSKRHLKTWRRLVK